MSSTLPLTGPMQRYRQALPHRLMRCRSACRWHGPRGRLPRGQSSRRRPHCRLGPCQLKPCRAASRRVARPRLARCRVGWLRAACLWPAPCRVARRRLGLHWVVRCRLSLPGLRDHLWRDCGPRRPRSGSPGLCRCRPHWHLCHPKWSARRRSRPGVRAGCQQPPRRRPWRHRPRPRRHWLRGRAYPPPTCRQRVRRQRVRHLGACRHRACRRRACR